MRLHRLALAFGVAATLSAPALAQEQETESTDARVKRLVPEILRDVVRLRGLAEQREIPAGAMGRVALREFLEAEMAREFPDARFEALSRAWGALGLVPAGTELRAEFLDLLPGQVAGFYDPRTKRFYLVDESARGGERDPMQDMQDQVLKLAGISMDHTVIAHELTHALQDQHFDLEHGVHELKDDDDRVLAARCVVEGDATHLMNEYMKARIPAMRDMAGGLDRMAGVDLEQLAAMQPGLRDKPRALWMPLIYPYIGGLQFVQRAHGRGGWGAVDALFRDLPASSEQVLHPEKYFAERRDAPVRVRFGALAPAEAWTLLEENTLGELMLRAWLRELGLPTRAAERATAGWGGDRFRAWALPDGGTAVALATTWDTDRDADEFERVLAGAGAVARRGRHVVVVRGRDGEPGRALADAVLGALRVGAAVETAAARHRLGGATCGSPGPDWRARDADPDAVAFVHAGQPGAVITVKRRGEVDDPGTRLKAALDALRARGVEPRDLAVRTTDRVATAGFDADGDRFELALVAAGGRLVSVIGSAPARAAAAADLAAAVRRVAESVAGE